MVADSSGNNIKVTDIGGGKYTFIMPSADINISASFVKNESQDPSSGNTGNQGSGNNNGSGGSSYSNKSYTVYPRSSERGKINIDKRNAFRGSKVTFTVTANKGYKLDEVIVTDESGIEINFKDEGNNKYSFTMPDSEVDIDVKFTIDTNENDQPNTSNRPTSPFVTDMPNMPNVSMPNTWIAWNDQYDDVPESLWCYDGIKYVTGRGMMNGVSNSKFAPDLKLTRGMLVTILYRMEGQPATGGASFSDISGGQYYSNAVSWAAGNDIVNGYKDGKFGPNDNITREQIASILYRYAKQKGYNTAGRSDLSGYPDSSVISGFASEPMQWANAAGLIKGTNNGMLNPNRGATRGQVAEILMRFCENAA